ncbi:MAG: GNAT family N-acetyltransferase [Candidatus Micrarchaeota archaeon]
MLDFEVAAGFNARVISSSQKLACGDGLATDLSIQKKIADTLGGESMIILGFEGQEIRGILPLWKYSEHGNSRWTFVGNDEVLPYNDFGIRPKHLPEFMNQVPLGTRLSNIHWRVGKGKGLETCVLVELPKSFIDYFSQLKPKVRQNLRRVYRKNQFTKIYFNRLSDIDEFGRLERNINFKSHEPFDVMTPKEEAEIYKVFVHEAHKRGMLRMMSMEVEDRLAAVNISFQSAIPSRGGARQKIVYDQLCLRKPGLENKFLGIYAIAKNIEWAIQEGVRYYDLGQGVYPYKMIWNVRPKKCRVWTKEAPAASP